MDCPDDRSSITPAAPQAWTLTIMPGGPSLQISDGVPLLTAVEQAGLDWPSSCRNGTCRSCMQRLAQGSVRYAIEWPGLLAEEKAEGWILPCMAFPTGDLVVADPVLQPAGSP